MFRQNLISSLTHTTLLFDWVGLGFFLLLFRKKRNPNLASGLFFSNDDQNKCRKTPKTLQLHSAFFSMKALIAIQLMFKFKLVSMTSRLWDYWPELRLNEK